MQAMLISNYPETQDIQGALDALIAEGIQVTHVDSGTLSESMFSSGKLNSQYDAVIVHHEVVPRLCWLLEFLSSLETPVLLLYPGRPDGVGACTTLYGLLDGGALACDGQSRQALRYLIGRHRRQHSALEQLSDVALQAPDALVGVDERGMVAVFNNAAERLFARRAESVLGAPMSELMPARYHGLHSHLATVLERLADPSLHMASHRKIFALRSDGREVPVEVSLSRVTCHGSRLVLAAIRDITAREIQASEYYHLATHDHLTGLLNRTAMWEALHREVARARHGRQDLSLLMVDVDRFKRVNDGWGHLVGDEVLVAVARRLIDSLRASDACFRFGGEEFVVILPGATKDDGTLVAERVRSAVADSPVSTRAGAIQCTVSIGVVSADGKGPVDANAMLHGADLAMLRAKRTGRNRVSVKTIKSMKV